MLVSLQLATGAVVPLSVIVLLPCVAPNPVPAIATSDPTTPEIGDKLVILRVSMTVKLMPLLETPLAFTTTFPVVAPLGTCTTMLVALQLAGGASVSLNVTVLVPCAAPKFVPVIVTEVPTTPEVTDKLLMLGAGTTVKLTPLLAAPATVTTTFPVVAPAGTGTPMANELQLVGVVGVPLKATVLEPWLVPKFVPSMVTAAPTAPVVGDRLVIPGRTVKAAPLLATPFTFTTTFPVVAPEGTGTLMLVALQLVGVVAVPLNVTVLEPCVDPKFVPVIVTGVPTAPDVTDKFVILGVGRIVKFTPLLATPLVLTTTFPVVAPLGTVTPILDAPHDVTLAVVPLNVTVPVPCELPKFDPVTVTAAPTAPDVIDKLVMLGPGTTVKFSPLLAWLDTVTTTFPVDAPLGTVTVILDEPHVVTEAVVPLNATVLVPCEEPYDVPVIVTAAPTAPVVIDKLVIAGVTVKFTPLLATPLALTTTFPVVALLGTVTPILDAPHDVTLAVVPLNLTVLLPWVEPNVVPVIVTAAPTAPVVIDKLVMAGVTVKLTPLLATPLALTTTFPVVAPPGTVTPMLDAPHDVTFAVVPLNVTVPVPCELPKFDPVIVTAAPTAPDVTDKLVMLGAGTTVKLMPLLAAPATVTTTFPVVAPLGTVTPILDTPHDVTVAVVPLNVTVPVPCELPKFDPVTVTAAPTAPDVIDKLVMLGAGTTVKLDPLLSWLDTVTTTFPVDAPLGTVTVILDEPHVVTEAVVPLNATVLVPCEEPNDVPVIVTAAPTAPVVIDKLVMAGVTVKFTPLLATPLALTTTFPVVAPLGTVTPMLDAPHDVTFAVVPLNVP